MSSFLTETTVSTDVYEGQVYACRVIYSPGWGRIEIFALSDRHRFYYVPRNRYESTLRTLRGGANPDELVKGFKLVPIAR